MIETLQENWLKELGIDPNQSDWEQLAIKNRYGSARIIPQHRALMARRTAPNERKVVTRMGYTAINSSYTDDSAIMGFSDSTLNREYAKIKKEQKQQTFESIKKKAAQFGETIHDFGAWQDVGHELLSDAQIMQRRNKRVGKPPGIGRNKSNRTIRKIQGKAFAFLRLCPKPSFTTLTFIEEVSDKKAAYILNKFMTGLHVMQKGFKYIWTAERQDNGRIHFHCVFSHYFPVQKINAMWVLAQYNSRLRFKNYPLAEIKKRYWVSMKQKGNKPAMGSIGEVLNPVNIKRIYNEDGLSLYITKYISKGKEENFDCRVWHCSRIVSRLFTKQVCNTSIMEEAISKKNSRVDKNGCVIQGKQFQNIFYCGVFLVNKKYFYKYLEPMERINKIIWDQVQMGKREILALFEELNFN
jgi:hypothetical protein